MLPISIIIMGVGDANFKSMDRLDSDETRLVDHANRVQVRDNVQFVPYNECRNEEHMLKNQVLMELPEQIEQ